MTAQPFGVIIEYFTMILKQHKMMMMMMMMTMMMMIMVNQLTVCQNT